MPRTLQNTSLLLMSNDQGIGKDEDYPGGKGLRNVDHWLKSNGCSRDNPFMKAAHAAEHARRSVWSYVTGNPERGKAEWERARSNVTYDYK